MAPLHPVSLSDIPEEGLAQARTHYAPETARLQQLHPAQLDLDQVSSQPARTLHALTPALTLATSLSHTWSWIRCSASSSRSSATPSTRASTSSVPCSTTHATLAALNWRGRTDPPRCELFAPYPLAKSAPSAISHHPCRASPGEWHCLRVDMRWQRPRILQQFLHCILVGRRRQHLLVQHYFSLPSPSVFPEYMEAFSEGEPAGLSLRSLPRGALDVMIRTVQPSSTHSSTAHHTRSSRFRE